MFRYLNVIWIPESPTTWKPDNRRQLVSYVLVWYSNGWSSKDISHEPTIWILNHLKSEFQKVLYSNVSGILIVSFQICNHCNFMSYVISRANQNQFLFLTWKESEAPGSAVIWLVMNTATLYSSEIFWSRDIICEKMFSEDLNNKP